MCQGKDPYNGKPQGEEGESRPIGSGGYYQTMDGYVWRDDPPPRENSDWDYSPYGNDGGGKTGIFHLKKGGADVEYQNVFA